MRCAFHRGPHGSRYCDACPDICAVIDSGYNEVGTLTGRVQLLDEAKNTPVRRLGTPDDIANVVAWLVSNESSFVTGETINASGGWYMRP